MLPPPFGIARPRPARECYVASYRAEDDDRWVDGDELRCDLVVIDAGPEDDDGAVDAGDRRRRGDPQVVTVQALANLILVVVKDAREFLGGETRGEEVLRRDVCGEDEVPPFVVRQSSRKGRRVLGKAVVPVIFFSHDI